MTALGKSSSPAGAGAGTKVKISGLIVSDEGGDTLELPFVGLSRFFALDGVADALSTKSGNDLPTQTFDVRNSQWQQKK